MCESVDVVVLCSWYSVCRESQTSMQLQSVVSLLSLPELETIELGAEEVLKDDQTLKTFSPLRIGRHGWSGGDVVGPKQKAGPTNHPHHPLLGSIP